MYTRVYYHYYHVYVNSSGSLYVEFWYVCRYKEMFDNDVNIPPYNEARLIQSQKQHDWNAPRLHVSNMLYVLLSKTNGNGVLSICLLRCHVVFPFARGSACSSVHPLASSVAPLAYERNNCEKVGRLASKMHEFIPSDNRVRVYDQ